MPAGDAQRAWFPEMLTYFATDFPGGGNRCKMESVFMTQLLPAGAIDLQDKFKVMVYQSIVDSYKR